MSDLDPRGLYCAYLRKSRRDEELEALGQGETLARHEHALKDLAARLGITIGHFYREIVSGDTIAQRPQVQQLLADISAGRWDGVLAMDVDRFGRGDSIDQGIIMQSFIYSGVPIITPDKIYDPTSEADSEFFEIKLFFSRREYAAIKKRMQRGRLASVMDGCYQSPRAPYGYERYKLPGRKGWSLRPVPEKAAIVRSVFAWYADGMDGQDAGSGVIAAHLNAMGLRTDLGRPFEPSYIRGMLQNPIYIGKVRWNQRKTQYKIIDGRRVATRPHSQDVILADGLHEPIVDADLFTRVQAIFAAHEKCPKNTQRQQVNPLAGLVFCAVCGRALQLTPSPDRADFLKCPSTGCPTARTYVHVVEAAILSELSRWTVEFTPADVPADPDPDAAARAAALKQLTDQRAQLSGQLTRLYDLLEQGIYSADLYRQRHADLSARLADLDATLAQLSAAPRPDPRASLVPRLRTVLDAYQAAPDPATKNALLRTVLDRVVYHKTQRCYRNDPPGAHLTLEIYPRQPSDDDDF